MPDMTEKTSRPSNPFPLDMEYTSKNTQSASNEPLLGVDQLTAILSSPIYTVNGGSAYTYERQGVVRPKGPTAVQKIH